MNIKNFENLLDRLGSDLSVWPSGEAEQARQLLLLSAEARSAHEMLLRLESILGESRPEINTTQVSRVIAKSLAEIATKEARPTIFERLRLLLAAPVPRAAFAMTLTAIGFAIGIAVGSPGGEQLADTTNLPLIMASADDVPF